MTSHVATGRVSCIDGMIVPTTLPYLEPFNFDRPLYKPVWAFAEKVDVLNKPGTFDSGLAWGLQKWLAFYGIFSPMKNLLFGGTM
jgi:hypothetical protein